MKKVFFAVAVMALGFISCENKDVIISENTNDRVDDQQFVLATHTTGLVGGVDSVQVIAAGHPLLEKFISFMNSRSSATGTTTLKSSSTLDGDIGIYYYENNKKALFVADEPQNIVYAYAVETSTKDLSNVFAISIIDSPDLPDEPDGLGGRPKFPSWGDCMEDAIGRLYNDWKNDPIGTTTCWLSGPLCVIGGGLACLLLLETQVVNEENNDVIQYITVELDLSLMAHL